MRCLHRGANSSPNTGSLSCSNPTCPYKCTIPQPISGADDACPDKHAIGQPFSGTDDGTDDDGTDDDGTDDDGTAAGCDHLPAGSS